MFKKGENFKDRVGETHKNKVGEHFTIIKCRRSSDLDVRFEDGTIITKRRYQEAVKGQIKNPNTPTVFGVGYFGIGKYSSKTHPKIYDTWINMIKRCYSEKELLTHQAYRGVNIYKDWFNFQNFAKWFGKSYNFETMNNWQLDKDILLKGNKIYSQGNCCFVPAEINMLFVKCDKARGDLPVGVFRSGNKYRAALRKKGARTYLGTFDTIEEAFLAYKTSKEDHIKEVADEWKPKLDPRVYTAMYNYQVEITD